MIAIDEEVAEAAIASILSRLKTELDPTLYYHCYAHTIDVMESAVAIAKKSEIPSSESRLIRIAAAFHDSGFLKTYRNHEAESCLLAKEALLNLGVPSMEIRLIEGMIMATCIPQRPKNRLEEILCDADLDYMGRGDYDKIAARLYQELSEWNMVQSERDWVEQQISFLNIHSYWTDFGKTEREPVKRQKLEELKFKAMQIIEDEQAALHRKNTRRVEEVDAIISEAWKINRDSPQLSMDKAREALEKAIAHKYDFGKAEACHIIGAAFGWMNRYAQGLHFTERAIRILMRNGFKSEAARAHGTLATIHFYRADFQSALKHYTASLNLFLANADANGEAEAYQGLGAVYVELLDFDQAWTCLNRALDMATKLGDDEIRLKTLSVMARLSNSEGKHHEAIAHFDISLKLSVELNQAQNVTYALQGLGDSYLLLGNLKQAEEYLMKCLSMRLEIGFRAGEGRTRQALGETYLQLGRWKEAEVELQKALELSTEGDRKGISMAAHLSLSKLFEKQEYFAQYAHHLSHYHELKTELAQSSKLRKQNFELEQAYQNTRILSDIGQEIISSLDLDKVLFTIYEKVNQLMDAAVFGIGLLNQEKESIDYRLAIASGVRYKPYSRDIREKNQLAVWCITQKSPVFINDVQKEWENYIPDQDTSKYMMVDGSTIERKEQSILYMPILNGSEILGLISVQSYARHAYTLYHLEVLRNVATYASIALINIGMYLRLENDVRARTSELSEAKEKSDKLLLNILPREIAEELKIKGYTAVRRYEETTVLFMDIEGFSKISEGMSPKQLVAEIDTYFSAFDTIMDIYGMEKIKTIGDAYIAAGGLPKGNKADALTVVKAAFAICQKIDELRFERESLNEAYFQFRIGINTGPVVAGVVGSKKFQYDIWGDAVNIAARMEQNSLGGKINISQNTYDRVKDHCRCVYRGKVEAKNKGLIDMYFVEELNE